MTDNEQYTDPAEIRHRIGANGVFSLGNVSGDIRLRGTDTDEVVAMARSHHGRSDKLPLVVRRSEGSLSIEIDQRGPLPFGLGWRGVPGVEFDITVPRGARVDVKSVSSDIDVTGLVGEQGYRTVSGDLNVQRAGGRLSLTTVSGDVNVDAHEPIEADASSTSGDLQVSGPSLRSMRLRTVSGDVELRGAFDAGAMHNIETVSGDVEIESSTGLTVEVRKGIDLGGGPKQRVIGDGAARLRFRSLSGDLNVAGSTAVRGVKDMPLNPPQERQAADSLEILRALERGEIDIEEASARLAGKATDA